jgi:hypothetical protein
VEGIAGMNIIAVVNPVPEAPYVVSMHELFWGAILVAINLVLHGMGMLGTLRFSYAFKKRFERGPKLVIGMANLILASWMITFCHAVEVMVWAGFFQWNHCFANYSTAAYFSLNGYTTLGSDLDLPQNWRLLEGMIATSGLIGFAWSTGVLMTLAQRFQDEHVHAGRQKKD